MANSLFDFIQQQVPLSDAEIQALTGIVVNVQAPSGAELSKKNTYCRDLYFITKGLVKLCFDSDGKEFIMRFFEEEVLFTDLESWNKKQSSEYKIIALENIEFITIPLLQFEQLCSKHHGLEMFYRRMMTRASLNMMDRIKEILEEDAKKRYSNFIKNHPTLLQRISLGDLSKYLGITQVSLSRIRADK